MNYIENIKDKCLLLNNPIDDKKAANIYSWLLFNRFSSLDFQGKKFMNDLDIYSALICLK